MPCVVPAVRPHRHNACIAQLSPTQRRALILAITQGIPKEDPGIRAATLTALADRELIRLRTSRKRGRQLWRATDVGRGLIARTGLDPIFLHKRSQYGYTNRYSQAMRQEPEVIRA